VFVVCVLVGPVGHNICKSICVSAIRRIKNIKKEGVQNIKKKRLTVDVLFAGTKKYLAPPSLFLRVVLMAAGRRGWGGSSSSFLLVPGESALRLKGAL
jgi:hypothetical protein